MKFDGRLEKYENNLWNYHIKVPAAIVDELKEKRMKRFLCSMNGNKAFHASLMPAGGNEYFIKINKSLRDSHNLKLGSLVGVQLLADDSDYGMPLPKEMAELFEIDPEGDRYFHQLTPGKQRSLLFIVNKLKSEEKRIEKSLIIIDHLKEQLGQLDFKILYEDFKRKKGRI